MNKGHFNVINELEIPLAKRQWKASTLVKKAREMDFIMTETMVSHWRRGIMHPNSKSRKKIQDVFEAHPVE